MSVAALDEMRNTINEQIRILDGCYVPIIEAAYRIHDERRRHARLVEIMRQRNDLADRIRKPLCDFIAKIPPSTFFISPSVIA